MQDFLDRFIFSPENAGKIGIEREFFLTNQSGNIQPIAPRILGAMQGVDWVGYELSACQLETRLGPQPVTYIQQQLVEQEEKLRQYEEKLDFKRSYTEVAPDDMPLDIYPDPSGRYQQIVTRMPLAVLRAACQVIGTHIHVGMPDHETALRVHNHVINHCDRLSVLGDHSQGKRLQLYAVVAPNHRPPMYIDWGAFHQHACSQGFEQEPRNCWHLIRISKHGTIEFRNFGATDDLGEIVHWTQTCWELCQEVM